jgi:5'-nucleotidase
MHVSGITVWYDSTAPAGARVRRMQLSTGQDIVGAGEYTVSVNDFMAGGGDGLSMLLEPRARQDLGIVDLDALISYLQKQAQPVAVHFEHRLRAATDGAGVGRLE